MNTVMDCGKDKVKEFVMKNASPEMLEKIGKIFDDDDDDDDEEWKNENQEDFDAGCWKYFILCLFCLLFLLLFIL